MNAIYWHMNATLGGANLHPGVNLLPGANLHPGANCAHEHGFRALRNEQKKLRFPLLKFSSRKQKKLELFFYKKTDVSPF